MVLNFKAARNRVVISRVQCLLLDFGHQLSPPLSAGQDAVCRNDPGRVYAGTLAPSARFRV
jgi:hypothetical protein